jgi:site-specific DNA-methyltransferase (adenine-specific)
VSALVRYDAACRAVAEAKTVDEAKSLHDKAEAMRAYARQAKNRQLEIDAAEIRMRAERRLGEMLSAAKQQGQIQVGRPERNGADEEPFPRTTLANAGIDKKLSSRAQKLAAVSEEKFEGMLGEWRERVATENERVTTNLLREGERAEEERERAEAARELAARMPTVSQRYALHHCPCIDALSLEAESVDLIVTDPPYPEEFLPVYSDLSRVASRVLKPNGLALVMVGQSYLPEVVARLGEHLAYHWTLAYLTPGGQAVQQFPRRVNAFWKPVLVYCKGTYGGAWFGDVTRSDVNDNDKDHHHWGQSASGMMDLMRRFVEPGHTVLDPFLGGGTTAIIALKLGATFIGYDVDHEAIVTTKARIGEIDAALVA